MSETLELENQKKIYLLISKQPGLSLSKIADILKISIELARYHLQYLEKNDLLSSSKDEGFRRYYLKGEIGIEDKKFLSLFRQEMLLKIVLFLIKNPYSRHKEILKTINIKSKPLLTYYLKKLLKKKLIEAHGKSRERRFVVVNEKEIIRFLVKYEPYNILEGISDTWIDFSIK